jgi:hypothetical protein
MKEVETIQERLEALARRDANIKVTALVESLPYLYDAIEVDGTAPDGSSVGNVKIQWHLLLDALRSEWKRHFFAEALKARTDSLLNAVNEIESIRSEIAED